MTVRHYIAQSLPYALAIVTGQLSTIALGKRPPEGIVGTRVAIFGGYWDQGSAIHLESKGIKFELRDRQRHGRLGTVMVMGWAERESFGSRKIGESEKWGKRPLPPLPAVCYWLVGNPKVEIGQPLQGLTRLAVAMSDRAEYIQAVVSYGDRYGADKLPRDCRELYDWVKEGSKEDGKSAYQGF